MRELSGRVAVVTGAASGIGRATSVRFGREGMRVAVADVDEPALDALVDEIRALGSEAIGVCTDVSSASSVEALRDATLSAFGAVHLLHNNAGVALPPMPIWQVSDAAWRWMVDINVGGVLNGIRAFVPLLVDQDEGHVVSTSSLAGLVRSGNPLGAYHATKHAIVSLSESLRADLERAGSQVGVSVLCPAAVVTNLTQTSSRNWKAGGERPDFDQPRDQGAIALDVLTADEVADVLVAAIAARRFYVVPQRGVAPIVEARFRAILEDLGAGAS